MSLCLCTICLNTVKIIERQQVVCGIIIETNKVILFQTDSESFKYKTSITGNTYDGDYLNKVDKKGN